MEDDSTMSEGRWITEGGGFDVAMGCVEDMATYLHAKGLAEEVI